ncbi:glycosyltransferase family 4 protein [Paracoccus benzoatiresistens]|uniref:Glycosyltransferase family 4 protein n=1 Tax=Paracoccus benzoatiresistens TaxID=2997341 RepID=A0ABT4J8L5_9RHOB|nr:glycosyltransferase family 4 protein [Paracoccus sp. EF6]MCZ0963434.1 glycosyltransferase family 4 protein [Paracoccus sp. EF6]
MCAGLLKRIFRQKVRIIAYNFNLGALPQGPRRTLARLAAGQIDRFVVHSPLEVPSYAEYLGVPSEKVSFIPLQRGKIDIAREEEAREPYLLALGSANRDYASLIAAVDELGIRTIIVTRPEAIEALPRSPHVTFMSGLSQRQCNELMARARISVTPVANQETASGQITFLTAMQLGVPVVVTRCPGTAGYIEDGRTGLLVEPGDVGHLKSAIEALWTSEARRSVLAEEAQRESLHRFSDKAAANSLRQIIREVAG